ncbi:54S ribosomal protein L33 [Lachnellula suecica]|uniref:Large ribosomal subunit protein uL30m n=1 Tax=Lachnellula suecica TaxID=602035 RepID=A0A8T9CBM5_9HELO|nr:54S ribosomal protein L33 [Lachnellula suecica]
MSFFRITLTRSGIGMPKRTQGVLKALGLRHRMATVFYPVTPEVAGQIMRVKELVTVQEVDKALTKEELRAERRPEAGFYLETAAPR